MTVKRRLLISNILMILLPVLLSIFVATVMASIATGFLNLTRKETPLSRQKQFSAMYAFENTIEQLGEDASLDKIAQAVSRFGGTYSQFGITLSVCRGSEAIISSGAIPQTPLIDMALAVRNAYFVTESSGIFTRSLGEYTLLLQTPSFIPIQDLTNPAQRRGAMFASGFMLAFLVSAVMFTNRFLTRIIVRSIVVPLDILVEGVHNLRDGHLDYRIIYNNNDEFRPVCDDFNEMAGQLAAMTEARRRDDESRRELIAGISHDLRTPLTAIKAYVEGLETGVASTEELRRRYLEIIRLKTENLEHIIGQLFLFSKLDLGEFPLHIERREIGGFLSDFVANAAEEYTGRGLYMTLESDSLPALVDIDTVQLRGALVNILENSLKYSGRDRTEATISCRASSEGRVIITLSDNGPGVPQESLPHLFDVFYRTDKARSNVSMGSGLGLAITRRLLNQMHGFVEAQNVPEGGLAIIISLPTIKEVK